MQTEKKNPLFSPKSPSFPCSDFVVISSSAVYDPWASIPSYSKNYTNRKTTTPELELELYFALFKNYIVICNLQ